MTSRTLKNSLFFTFAILLLGTFFPVGAQLSPQGLEWIDQGHPLVSGDAEPWDRFGERIATGDFDGDGHLDLVVSAPGQDRAVPNAGTVHILYRDDEGDIVSEELLELGVGLPGTQEEDDRFGDGHISIADFDTDGFDDLVVGSWLDDVDGLHNAGSILVIPGGPEGMDKDRALFISQQPELLFPALPSNNLGKSTTGDFDGDGFDDLAFGMIGGVNGFSMAGVVQVLYGTLGGLNFLRVEAWHQGLDEIPGELALNDRFGTSLGAADFDGDGYDDLAIGASRDDIDGIDAGSVTVLRGGSTGLTSDGVHVWTKGKEGLVGEPASGELFGGILAVGDVHGDGYADLAIADIKHQADGVEDTGGVWVLAGGPDGLSAWHHLFPGSVPVGGPPLSGAHFGFRMAMGDFNGDGRDDLVASSLDEIVGGRATMLYATPGGFGFEWTQHWSADFAGLPEPTAGYGFANSFAVANLDGQGGEELIIGYSSAEVDGQEFAGGIAVVSSDHPSSCAVSPNGHCLQKGRFLAQVRQRVGAGPWEDARTVAAVADDSGLFWFSNPRNWEMMLKVLDGCSVNDHFWVFLAATTDVEYEVTLTDTWTGTERIYLNPGGPAEAQSDTRAFATCDATLPANASPAPPKADPVGLSHVGCPDLSDEMCFQKTRFRAKVDWWTAAGDEGQAHVVPLGSNLSGLFWFFREDNWEMMIKILDGCSVNDHYWVYAAAATDVGYRLTVTDQWTGKDKVYENPLGQLAPAITDSGAFKSCP